MMTSEPTIANQTVAEATQIRKHAATTATARSSPSRSTRARAITAMTAAGATLLNWTGVNRMAPVKCGHSSSLFREAIGRASSLLAGEQHLVCGCRRQGAVRGRGGAECNRFGLIGHSGGLPGGFPMDTGGWDANGK